VRVNLRRPVVECGDSVVIFLELIGLFVFDCMGVFSVDMSAEVVVVDDGDLRRPIENEGEKDCLLDVVDEEVEEEEDDDEFGILLINFFILFLIIDSVLLVALEKDIKLDEYIESELIGPLPLLK